MLSIAETGLFGKVLKTLIELLQKTKSTQTSGSVFAEKIEKVKKAKFELEITKMRDCLLDGYDTLSSILVTFENKTLSALHFLRPIEI